MRTKLSRLFPWWVAVLGGEPNAWVTSERLRPHWQPGMAPARMGSQGCAP
ncbi:hypothetical protein [Synechococcus sp. ROS8604]|nr:hypothetical protein [Synechococcus sp. ROS8604]